MCYPCGQITSDRVTKDVRTQGSMSDLGPISDCRSPKPNGKKRSWTSTKHMLLDLDQDEKTLEHAQTRSEAQIATSSTGCAATLQRMIAGEDVKPQECKQACLQVGGEFTALTNVVQKITTNVGGSLVMYYATPTALPDKKGDDQENCELCGLPDQATQGVICTLCQELIDDGLAEIAIVPAHFLVAASMPC